MFLIPPLCPCLTSTPTPPRPEQLLPSSTPVKQTTPDGQGDIHSAQGKQHERQGQRHSPLLPLGLQDLQAN